MWPHTKLEVGQAKPWVKSAITLDTPTYLPSSCVFKYSDWSILQDWKNAFEFKGNGNNKGNVL